MRACHKTKKKRRHVANKEEVISLLEETNVAANHMGIPVGVLTDMDRHIEGCRRMQHIPRSSVAVWLPPYMEY